MGNPTMWFEVAAKDREGMKGFYSGLFDWKLTDMEGMPYTGIETGGGGHPRRHRRGARGQTRVTSPSTSRSRTSRRPGQGRVARRQRAMGPIEIPSGEIALFADPEGHVVGLMNMNRPPEGR